MPETYATRDDIIKFLKQMHSKLDAVSTIYNTAHEIDRGRPEPEEITQFQEFLEALVAKVKEE